MDDHWVKVTGGHGLAEVTDEAIYLAIALRNVGSGLAVLHGWSFYPERHSGPGRAYRSVPPERSTPCRPHLSIARPPPSFHGRGRRPPYVGPSRVPPYSPSRLDQQRFLTSPAVRGRRGHQTTADIEGA